MKKLLVIAMLLASGTAFADHHHGHNHGYWRYSGDYRGWGWVAPAVIGGVIVYEATRPPVIVQQPAPYVVQPQVTQNVCSPWTQVQNPDGTVTYTRTCNQ